MKFRLTAPDYISFSRIFLTPLTLILLTDWVYSYVFMVMVLAFVSASDFLDGYLARKYKTTSNFGAFLDFTADKIFIAAMLIVLAVKHLLPAWIALIIIAREFLVSGVRIYAAIEGFVVPSSFWGKLKTTITFVAMFGSLLIVDFLDILNLIFINAPVVLDIVWIATVILTLLSGWGYVNTLRQYVLGYEIK